MYERLLDRASQPTKNELTAYCGENSNNFKLFNEQLSEQCGTAQIVRFPYGKKYGWCITHRKGKRLICDVFAEDGAFTVMVRLSNDKLNTIYTDAVAYMRDYIDNRFPCEDGGWIHYRVSCFEHMEDIQRLMKNKCD